MTEAVPKTEDFQYPDYHPLVHDLDIKSTEGIDNRFTDRWNAMHFIERYQGVVRYCNPLKMYYIWNGLNWAPDDYCEMRRLCQEHISDMLADKKTHENPDLLKHLVKSLSATGIRNMMFFIESNRLTVRQEELDADHDRINALNCVVNLDTCKPEEPSIDRFLTKQMGAKYDPDATCPTWIDHLKLIFDNDQETIDSFQMIAGYSLLYFNPLQVFFIHWGSGGNGKSVTLKVLKAIWGGYARSAEYRTFMQRRSDDTSVRTDIERLYGCHMVLAVEGKENGQLNEQLLKWITGGDEIVSRGLYEKEKEKPIYSKIHLVTNPKPVIKDNTPAMLRRIIMIPYNVKIPDTKRDGMMEERLLTERDGIFLWCLQGLKAWQDNGRRLKLSKIVVDATASYKDEIDGDREFFQDDIEIQTTPPVNPKDIWSIAKKELFENYLQWYNDKHGEYPSINLKEFNKVCTAHGITRDKRTNAGYVWNGVRHLSAPEREAKKQSQESKEAERKAKALEVWELLKSGISKSEYINKIVPNSELVNDGEPHPINSLIRVCQDSLVDSVHSSSQVHHSDVKINTQNPMGRKFFSIAEMRLACISNCGRDQRDKCDNNGMNYPKCGVRMEAS